MTPFASQTWEEELRALGISSWGVIDTDTIVFSEEVHGLCAANRCGNYAKTWACPPAVGTLDECRARVFAYRKALVFSGVYELEDSFDLDGMREGHRSFRKACMALPAMLSKPYLLLGNEGCGLCETCTYPDAPCRFPDRMIAPVEGYGILVYALAKQANLSYRPRPNTVAYFGMICFDQN